MCKRKFKSFVLIIFLLCIFVNLNTIFANSISEETKQSIEEKAKELLENKNGEIDITKIVTEYEKLSKEYTNEEIADYIEENKDKLEEKGISSEVVSIGTEILRTIDEETVNKVLKEDINIDEVKEKINEGETTGEIIEDISKSLTTKDKINIALKLLFENKIFKLVVFVFTALIIYSIILRWRIFKKAGKYGFASIIPIYRDIVYFKVCSISPWVILLILVPIIGWIILAVIKIVSRFELSYNFGRKTGFGLGLWILPIIFESIIAFSKNIKYMEK